MSLSPSEEHILAMLPEIPWRAAPLSPTDILLRFGCLPTPVTFELPGYPSVRHQLYTTPHNDLVQGLFPDYLISASLLSRSDTTTLDSSCDLIQHLLSKLPNHYNQGQWTCHFLEDPDLWKIPLHGCFLAEFLTQVTVACVAATGGTCSDMRIWRCHQTEDIIDIICMDATFESSGPNWKIAHAGVALVSKHADIYSTAASLAARMFTTQDTRRWVIVIVMCSTTFSPFLFDRGGSIQGVSMNIHTEAHTFLQLILGLTFIPSQYQGYDTTIIGQGLSSMLSGSLYGNLLIQLILSQSPKMYGQGSVVRLLKLTSAQLHQLFSDVHPDTIKWLKGLDPNARETGIIMKDTWHDQYSTFTEGTILTLLRDKGVKGVPRLLFEYAVLPPDAPSLVISGDGEDAKTYRSAPCDHTAYIRARAGLTYYPPMDCEFTANHGAFQPRVHVRLGTHPYASSIAEFSSLYELFTVMIDLLTTHSQALDPELGCNTTSKGWEILHRDPSIWNCMMVDAEHSDWGSDENNGHTRRGLLIDWGSAFLQRNLPLNHGREQASEAQGITAKKRKASTREDPNIAEEECFFHLYDTVGLPVSNGQLNEDVLKFCLEHDRKKNDFVGTYPFMAVERLRGCRVHNAVAKFNKQRHDLEGFFYVLTALCTWFHEPYTPKVFRRASFLYEWLCCTDEPLKEQARNKWLNLRCHGESFLDENLSPYFVPAKSALQRLSELVLPPDWRQIEAPESEPVHPPVTHAAMIQVLKEEREKLPEEARIPWQPTPEWKETVATISSDGILANKVPSELPFTPRVVNDDTPYTMLGIHKHDLPQGYYRAVAPGVTLSSDIEYIKMRMREELGADVYLAVPFACHY